MDKSMVREDWKRHSAPYDFNFEMDKSPPPSSVSKVVDEAMEAFAESRSCHRASTIGRERKKNNVTSSRLSVYVAPTSVELSTDQYTPGVLKIFGETILPGVQYKSVLASCRSTAQELVKQALERFGLPTVDYSKFVLCDVVGNYQGVGSVSVDTTEDFAKSGKWERNYVRILSDRDKPLLLQKFWKPIDGFCRRYELHERENVMDAVDDDDTFGLNENARKILMSKLRPGAIPMFDASKVGCHANGLSMEYAKLMRADSAVMGVDTDTDSERETTPRESPKTGSNETFGVAPTKCPFFLNVRGFDVHTDKVLYPIRSRIFSIGSSNASSDLPHICLLAPDIKPTHCNFKVYKFKRTNGVHDVCADTSNFFLEMETLSDNVFLNGHPTSGKAVVKSGDILCIGKFYVLVYKDCSKGFDIPLQLPWLGEPAGFENGDYIQLEDIYHMDDEEKSNTDESMDISIAERMSFAYAKEKEDELVKYICAIIQQQNTAKTYPLSSAFLFGMCIEYASRKFERRQLKHLFLRILFTVRENVADAAKALSTSKFSCTLLESGPDGGKDQTLERLLLWISNCIQLLLFLKHTFQLPDPVSPDLASKKPRGDKSSRKEDSAKHALGQLVTGLEEIIMFCFQQSVYTITKALYPTLAALLDSNPFSEDNSEQCSMEDITRLFEALAEVTHFVMLHEGVTRQLFTYLFFFTSTNVFNKLLVEESGTQYYNWSSGVRVRANLSHMEDWATQNGLEDEFSQMFDRLLAASELLATSRNTLVKYPWGMMKEHYQPLTRKQLHHLLVNYQTGGQTLPPNWSPPADEEAELQLEELTQVSLCTHPPFALPDNCGVIDLIRTPEDPTFWNHLRRLRTLYGIAEDDSDSGFSIGHTPRCPSSLTKPDADETFFVQTTQPDSIVSKRRGSHPDPVSTLLETPRSRIPVRKSNTNPWSAKVPKPGTGVCKCPSIPRSTPRCQVIEGPDDDDEQYSSVIALKSLTSARGSEERRESLELDDMYHQQLMKEIAVASIDTHQLPTDVLYGVSATENREVLPVSRSESIGPRNGSAKREHVLDRRERSRSMVSDSVKDIQKMSQSFSMEDLHIARTIHRPSASFEEAIERGYESDTLPLKASRKPNERLSAISEQQYCQRTFTSNSVTKPDFYRQWTTESALSDDVFSGGHDSDGRTFGQENYQTLPAKTSRNGGLYSSFSSPADQQTRGAFEEHSVSSLKLSKGKLATGRNGIVNGHMTVDQDGTESLPRDMLVEVSENTLATRKRQCTSLNVIPTDSESPRQEQSGKDLLDLEEHKRMSPCPLFTVYLRKTSDGLGLGLIDGLHTPLRLAGIYIRKILPGSPAASNGCLQVGDRILAVCNTSVIGADYQSTMELIRSAGESLTLLVARGNDSMARKVSASPV